MGGPEAPRPAPVGGGPRAQAVFGFVSSNSRRMRGAAPARDPVCSVETRVWTARRWGGPRAVSLRLKARAQSRSAQRGQLPVPTVPTAGAAGEASQPGHL